MKKLIIQKDGVVSLVETPTAFNPYELERIVKEARELAKEGQEEAIQDLLVGAAALGLSDRVIDNLLEKSFRVMSMRAEV